MKSEVILSQISRMNQQLTAAQEPTEKSLQLLLDALVGCSFDSLEMNQRVADELRYLMLRLNMRVQCPKEGCQEAALIRCRQAGRTKHGSFVFEHRMGARPMAHAASIRLPPLRLVPAPPDRRRKHWRERK